MALRIAALRWVRRAAATAPMRRVTARRVPALAEPAAAPSSWRQRCSCTPARAIATTTCSTALRSSSTQHSVGWPAHGIALRRSPCRTSDPAWATALTRRALTTGTVPADVEVFDRGLKRRHRNEAAAADDYAEYDYIRDEVARRVADRLNDITHEFRVAADLGSGTGSLAREIVDSGRVHTLYVCDLAEGALQRQRGAFNTDGSLTASTSASADDDDDDDDDDEFGLSDADRGTRVVPVVCDEEFLPFADGSLDLVMSSMSLHWVNDLPGCLAQIRRALKPDGVFVGAMLGGETLTEMRESFAAAELAVRGGVSPRVSPMAQVADAGMLLSSAGFALPTVDIDTIEVEYPSARAAMRHLRAMGEANAVKERRPGYDEALHEAAAAEYARRHGVSDGSGDGDVPVRATFSVIYLIGWTPAVTQQQPLPRGTAQFNLKHDGFKTPPDDA